MAPVTLSSPEIASASLHAYRPLWTHLYAAPFAALYPVLAYAYYVRYDDWLGSEEYTFVAVVGLVAAHALSFLLTRWSIRARALVTCRSVSRLDDAQCVCVIPLLHRGRPEIVPIEKKNPAEPTSWTFAYNHETYVVQSLAPPTFGPIPYPCASAPALGSYTTAAALQPTADTARLHGLYGGNTFDIPIPTFTALFAEHAVAPFFVFQVFCVGLWMLDEYWYYSLFTLFMLVVFECTVVFQRVKTLQEFRTMSVKPFPIQCLRDGKWTTVNTDALYPGDLVSVVRSTDDRSVPADLLLLSGTVIVNEAMLSGESTPLVKESIQLREPDERLDMDGAHRGSVLFGGTKALQCTKGVGEEELDRSPADGTSVVGPDAQHAAATELETTTATALTLDSEGEAGPAATTQPLGAAHETGTAQRAEQPEALGDQPAGGAPSAEAADPGAPFPAPAGPPPPTPARPPAKHAFPGTPSDGATIEDRRESRRMAMERQVHDTVAEELAEIAAQPDAPAADASAHSPTLAQQLRAHTAERFDQFMLEKDDATIAAVHDLAIEAGASPDAQPMSPSIAAHQRRLIRRRRVLDDEAVAREVAEDVFGTREATAARTAARIAELARTNPAALGIQGAGNAPANPIDLMHIDADEPAAPAGPAALPPRGTGVILPGAGTLTEEERATARAAHAQLATSTTAVDAAGDNAPIDGMPLNAHLRGADPLQARDFENLNTIMVYVTIISLGNNFDTAGIAPMAAASALLAALKFALGPIIPNFDPQAAPVLEDPAHPGLLRALTLVVYGLTPLALEILTSRRFWLINNIRLIIYRVTEPASDFVYTLQGLFTEDEARVAALLRVKWGEPGGAVAAFLTRHRARFPDVAEPLARLLEGVRAVKLVTIMPRSKGVEVVQFNTFAGMGFLPPDLHRQLRIILSNIPVRDSFLGISTHVSPSWFCKTCRASAHPTGLCGALAIRNWKPEEQQQEEPEAEHLLFGEERASRGRGGYRGRGGRGGRGRGRGFA